MQQKFQGMSHPTQNKEPKSFDVKDEYAMSKDQSNLINYEEIRRKLNFIKENSIQLKGNENLKLLKYDQSQNFHSEKKPKTSSEATKSNRLELLNAGYSNENYNENFEYENNNLNTDSNAHGDGDKFLYNIVSKKIKTPGIAPYKNYESTLPTFKISQRINKASTKEFNNIKNASPANRINSNPNQISLNNNFGTNNMNYTSNNNRFLPSINSNKNGAFNNPGASIYGEKNSINNGFKLTKGLQFNYNFNK